MLGDGDYADAAPPQHRFEGDGVLALAREAAELPDEDLLERSVGAARVVEHLPELRPVRDAAALGLVDVFAHDDVAVLLGVLAQGAQLGGHGEVDVLAVAGDASIQRDGHGVGAVGHRSCSLGSGASRLPGSREASSARTIVRHDVYTRSPPTTISPVAAWNSPESSRARWYHQTGVASQHVGREQSHTSTEARPYSVGR